MSGSAAERGLTRSGEQVAIDGLAAGEADVGAVIVGDALLAELSAQQRIDLPVEEAPEVHEARVDASDLAAERFDLGDVLEDGGIQGASFGELCNRVRGGLDGLAPGQNVLVDPQAGFSQGTNAAAEQGVQLYGPPHDDGQPRHERVGLIQREVSPRHAGIRRIAHEFAEAQSAVCYGRLGTCVQPWGTVVTWLIDVLNVMTGNMDRQGGAMFPRSPTDLAAWAPKLGQAGSFARWRSRVRGLPEFSGETPLSTFAEECEVDGPGKVRALVTLATNPVLSAPHGRRIDRALESLELMVAIDPYMNETTRHAHLILPPVSPLERDHHPLLFHALSVRNWARFSPSVFPVPAGGMPDWQILVELGAALGRARGPVSAAVSSLQRKLSLRLGPRGLLGALLRLGPYRLSVEKLLRHPHGIDLGPLEPRLHELMGRGRATYDIAPEVLVAELGRASEALAAAAPSLPGELLLIGRRHLRSNNSWLHNSARMVRGPERCTPLMNPGDADRLGMASGRRVTVTSRVGKVSTRLEVTAEMMPGVVSLPHGWGHDREGVQLRVASRRPGVSLNDLSDDAVTDGVSGTSVLNGIAVRVTVSR